ncbi:class I SAM-dependent methyltransferase [Thermomonas sp. HDW16]|uniref:class I SAM-dependent methyltransferase n=1 Tax=Thermomonas sp. HDW16 TaxID=2714945 RepID=UPI00140C056B|nr:class I SAM-dependent methyltransferase [Thermomonas sp. HDW16]QIL21421.1 class I SAM-dependent methyltransferase [Thermomonas sp. HDW16]
MELEHIACDLCGNPGYRVRYRKPDNWLRGSLYAFPVVECDECHLVYVNPRPTMAAMSSFYPTGYHDGRDHASYWPRYQEQQALLPELTGKRVLDIGCARGDFLSFLLDRGHDFEAHGIDAFSMGVADPRISFTKGSFNSAAYPEGWFDLVMAWAVFEHLHEPSSYFTEAARVLAPGGKLIILVTNAESLYGRVAYLEDVPRHTYHYSEKTLAAYAEKSSLRLLDVRYDDRIFDGRGRGMFRILLGRLAGFSWEKMMRNELQQHHRAAMMVGGLLDTMLFATHWEAKLRRSGIMVATYEKP